MKKDVIVNADVGNEYKYHAWDSQRTEVRGNVSHAPYQKYISAAGIDFTKETLLCLNNSQYIRMSPLKVSFGASAAKK